MASQNASLCPLSLGPHGHLAGLAVTLSLNSMSTTLSKTQNKSLLSVLPPGQWTQCLPNAVSPDNELSPSDLVGTAVSAAGTQTL